MARTDSLNNYLTDVATAIKNKYDITGTINASNFDTTITNGKIGIDGDKIKLVNTNRLSQQELDNLINITNNLSGFKLNTNQIQATYLTFTNGTFTDASGLDGMIGSGALGSLFESCTNMTIPPILDLSRATATQKFFNYCSSLTYIPAYNLELDTNVSNFCNNCTNLTDVPFLHIGDAQSKTALNVSSMFTGCPNLTDTSLDNIMKTLLNSTNTCGIRTNQNKLSYIFSSGNGYKARIQNMQSYSDLISAGWTDDLTS